MSAGHHAWASPRLGQKLELKVYGETGRPMLVFPTSRGRFYQYEDFGMVEACRPWLAAGRLKIYAVDGIDEQSWWNEGAHPIDRARRHEAYDACIVEEVVPFIRQDCRTPDLPILTTGCSFGAYHAASSLLRHPEVFDSCVCLSGVYSVREFTGDVRDEVIERNDPLSYLSGLSDGPTLDRLRETRIILCAGQGAWEDRFVHSSRQFSGALRVRGIDHWLDLWGHDVGHDWPWWRRQIAYFLGHLLGEA